MPAPKLLVSVVGLVALAATLVATLPFGATSAEREARYADCLWQVARDSGFGAIQQSAVVKGKRDPAWALWTGFVADRSVNTCGAPPASTERLRSAVLALEPAASERLFGDPAQR